MKLTAKGRYAVIAMVDLSRHQRDDEAVPLGEIAERQQLSQAFLEQLFAKLKKHQLVCSVRGPKGGYRLNLPSKIIKVADIVKAINEDTDSTHCKGEKNCRKGEPCLTHDVWAGLSEVTNNYLSAVSLADINAGHLPAVTIQKGE